MQVFTSATTTPLKSALYSFDLFETFDFQTDIGQNRRNLFGRQIDIYVTFEPIIRNIHRRTRALKSVKIRQR